MKASILLNTLADYITDQQIIDVIEGLDDPFFGQYVREDLSVSISLWDVDASFVRYGHWKVTVKIEINFEGHKEKLVLNHTTTDSQAIDLKNSSDDEDKKLGYLSLFSECMDANNTQVYEALDVVED